MNNSSKWIGIIAGVVLAMTFPATAQEHDHGHGHASQVELHFDRDGRKWPTDAPLRRSMAAMRGAVAAKLAAIHGGRMTQPEYAALGQTLEQQVGNIVAQCRLAPEADAMLHIVVADLLAAADVLQGKAGGSPSSAAHRAASALNAYGRHFDHPRWKALE